MLPTSALVRAMSDWWVNLEIVRAAPRGVDQLKRQSEHTIVISRLAKEQSRGHILIEKIVSHRGVKV